MNERKKKMQPIQDVLEDLTVVYKAPRKPSKRMKPKRIKQTPAGEILVYVEDIELEF